MFRNDYSKQELFQSSYVNLSFKFFILIDFIICIWAEAFKKVHNADNVELIGAYMNMDMD